VTSTAVPTSVAPARLPTVRADGASAARWERWIPEWVRRIGTAVWVSGPDGRIVFMNERAERLLATTSRESVGRPCHAVVAGRGRCGAAFCGPRCRVAMAADAGDEVEPTELRVGGRPGRAEHWLEVTSIPVEGPDRAGRWIVHSARVVDRARRIERYVERLARRSDAIRALDAPTERRPLTPRERDVLDLLADDVEPGRAAAALGISRATVRNHVQHLLAKLGAHSVQEAVAMRVLADA
jgi:DNA-binding CsgD family transcriptional regulator